MSYDLMVFEPTAPPQDRKGFMDWYLLQISWSEDHGHNNPEVSTPKLRSWFQDMVKEYPSIDDPKLAHDIDNPKLTGYSFGKSIIYIDFRWSEAENAHKTVFRLAKKHKLGFFDASTESGEIWWPDSKNI